MSTTAKSTPAPPPEKKRDRSPNFPMLDLKTAIERAATIYKFETKNAARVAVIVKHWGYGDKSSGGKRALAALNAYGLLEFIGEGEKREGKLSAAALRIVLNTPERDEEIKKAALRPRIHSELWTKYAAAGLPSDANLSSHLIMEKDFNKDVVPSFIRQFRATMAFAKLTEGDKIPPPPTDDEGGEEDAQMVAEQERGGPKSDPPPPLRPGMKEAKFPVEAGEVVLRFPSVLTSDEISDIDEWLDLMKRKIARTGPSGDTKTS